MDYKRQITKKTSHLPCLCIASALMIALLALSGCETKLNQNWRGFGTASGIHPFPQPYLQNHTGYLQENLYPLDNCQLCHGADYSGGVSGPSCTICHTFPNGPEACNTCHGNFNGDPSAQVNQAPPADIQRNSATDSIGVGAHTTHLTGGPYTDGVDCHSCHQIPQTWNSAGHIDPQPAEVVFSELAIEEDADPVWNRQTQTCQNTYCHRPGVPVWTVVDGTQAACGTCHHIPPSPGHPAFPTIEQCYLCHGSVIDSTGTIIRPDLHINGEVE